MSRSSFGTTTFLLLVLLLLSSQSSAQFTNIGANLAGVSDCSIAWGDYDSDRDLDLALSGKDSSGSPRKILYKNDGGSFIDSGVTFQGSSKSVTWADYDSDNDLDLMIGYNLYLNHNAVLSGFISTPVIGEFSTWGDYDNDGDLDLVSAGMPGTVRMTKIYRNTKNVLTDAGINLIGVEKCSLAWGDYDNDGDLDLVVAGYTGSSPVSKVYRNDNGTFTDTYANLPGVYYCSLAWGDYDNDGDLDLALAGMAATGNRSKVYRNDNGNFIDINAAIPSVSVCALAWGDYDSDGDLDLVLAGLSGSGRISKIYRNDNGAFIESGVALEGVSLCSVVWGDYDKDGDLDLALAGFNGSTCISKIYRNDSGLMNSAPSAPTGLSASPSNGQLLINWNAATDTETPASGLSYNVRVGTAPGKSDVFSGMADLSNGIRRLPTIGNAQKKLSWRLNVLPGTYYCSVQAIDTAYAGSTWADEVVVILPAVVVSGHVRTLDGTGLSGIPVNAEPYAISDVTDDTGYYKVTAVTGWSGTVTPEKEGSVIDPLRRSYSNVTEDMEEQNYLIYIYALKKVFSPPSVSWSSVAWGDYDNDGDLDFVLAGYADKPISRIYRNDTGTFIDSGANLEGMHSCSLAWGDYDGDEDLDLALAGTTVSGNRTIIYNNDKGTFRDLHANLLGVFDCYLAWGDYDNDGDLDLAVAGESGSYTSHSCKIYRNDAGTFVDSGADLVGVYSCSLAWGDYDNDGDLDLVVAGETGSSHSTIVYRNDGGTFIDSRANIVGVRDCSVAWGDYDNDGDIDLALAGTSISPTCRIYRNDNGNLTDVNANLVPLVYGCVAWADFDCDGDLDLTVAGTNHPNGSTQTRMYKNDHGIFTDTNANWPGLSASSICWGDYDNDGDLDFAEVGRYGSSIYRNDNDLINTPPAVPGGLSASLVNAQLLLSWYASTDARTPSLGLSYNIRVGTAPGKGDVFSGMADISTGRRRIPATGNAQKKLSWKLNVLPGTYYWSVQAIDTAYAGSAWAGEQTSIYSVNPKEVPDGIRTSVASATVTKVFNGYFYIERDDRTYGIRVQFNGQMPTEGSRVNVVGALLTTADGERCIQAEIVTAVGQGSIKPLNLVNSSIGGGAHKLQQGIHSWRWVKNPDGGGELKWLPAEGLNNIGLLVKVCGKVTAVDPSGDYLYIDDGSRVKDGTSTGETANTGIRVVASPSGYAVGDYLEVTGISSCFKIPSGELVSRILVSRPEDVRKLQ